VPKFYPSHHKKKGRKKEYGYIFKEEPFPHPVDALSEQKRT
jgi:hypothetical protein